MKLIALPVGDAAGISPEIIIKSLVKPENSGVIVCGSSEILSETAKNLGISTKIASIASAAEYADGRINVIEVPSPAFGSYEMGKISAKCGKAAYDCIEKAVCLALSDEAAAVTTTAINKESLRAAGVPFIGHTEIIAHLCGAKNAQTIFVTGSLMIFFLSRHLSLRAACDFVTSENVYNAAKLAFYNMDKLGMASPSLAVAGLNPHCGEHGLFGDEERQIEKAVLRLSGEGYNICGPIGADSVFHLAKNGAFSAVLSLYHDQGHIASKTLDFERTVSITAGLPFLRTSVDHGTAFDIAGKGLASEVSLDEAIKVAKKFM